MSYFSSNYTRINYPIGSPALKGLRNAQIGAIHAIASHFTLYDVEPALLVMPTGSGKTAVLNLAPYVLRARRVLVISSSVLVRGQIFEEFETLKTLKASNVFHVGIARPAVKEIKSPIKSIDEWQEMLAFDVAIGIPNSINEGITGEVSPPLDLFDLILVDEAHHLPAFTWTNIITHFPQAKKIFFTATPFRRDRKEITGKLAYYYPLSKAYADHIFGDIGYYPVVTDDPDIDLAIAREAERIFQKDKDEGFVHYMMVRTESKEDALRLEKLYGKHTRLRLKRVDSSVTYSSISKTIAKLRQGELDGIICVDMLGEGFDFPNLKIAAIHSPKKSLANTLQFIGRFARTNAENIGEAKFIAATSDIEIGKKRLYAEGAIWNDIIKNLSEEKIEEEDEIKDVLDTFEDETDPDLAEEISFYNINPYCHVKIYKSAGLQLDQTLQISGQPIVFHRVSEELNALVFITREAVKPKWVSSADVLDVTHYLYILFYDTETGLLFIHSSIKTPKFYDELVNQFSNGPAIRVAKYHINKVLADISDPEFFNIGMQSRNANSGETYRISAGPHAESIIRKSHGKNFANGHVFLRGVADTENITVGYSSASKVWSNAYLKVPNFIKWCQVYGKKIVSDKVVKTNTGFDFLPIGEVVKKFPYPVHSAIWNHETFMEYPVILQSVGDHVVGSDKLLNLAIEVNRTESTEDLMVIDLVGEGQGFSIPLWYDFENHYQIREELPYKYEVEGLVHRIDLVTYLNECPLHLYLLKFATVIDHEYYPPESDDAFSYDVVKMESFDWAARNTDITLESYDSPNQKVTNRGKNSIHESFRESLLEKGFPVIIYDHGNWELADFVTFQEFADSIEIVLYHVKGSAGNDPGDRVNDVYEVCMQAIKSQVWTVNKSAFTSKLRDRVHNNPGKFLAGSEATLNELMEKPKRIAFKFGIVQPGISHETFSPKLSYILAATDDSIINNGYSPLIVIGS